MLPKNRQNLPDELDNDQFSGQAFEHFLADLRRINVLFGTATVFVGKVMKAIKQSGLSQVVIADIGCASGDLLIKIARKCAAANIQAKLIGVDANPHCIEYARKNSSLNGSITYLQANVLDPDFSVPQCNFLISAHFPDHLTDDQFIHFIKNNRERVTNSLLINEAERNALSYFLFKYFSFLILPRKNIRRDVLYAIKRAFKKKELETLLHQYGVAGFSVKRIWSFHLLLRIEQPALAN
jgi:2-polyprenyl-3-methyl-5-hydroxy-6-metoxy-1,4-benzoquinol methylase